MKRLEINIPIYDQRVIVLQHDDHLEVTEYLNNAYDVKITPKGDA
jgi:hypothetical protein